MKYPRFAAATLVLGAYSICLPAQVVISPADLANLKLVSDPQISPSGKEVAYAVTTPVDPGKHKSAHLDCCDGRGRHICSIYFWRRKRHNTAMVSGWQ